jgi:hypothetical protein
MQLFMYHMEINFWSIKYKGMSHNIKDLNLLIVIGTFQKVHIHFYNGLHNEQAYLKWHSVEDNEAFNLIWNWLWKFCESKMEQVVVLIEFLWMNVVTFFHKYARIQ